MKWLFDTNVVSESVQARPDAKVMRWIASASQDDVAISIVTMAELRDGASTARNAERRNELTKWLDSQVEHFFRNRTLPITTEILIDWVQLARKLRSQGTPRDPADVLIASTARVHKLAVASRNIRDFAGTGVVVYDPWTGKTHAMDAP